MKTLSTAVLTLLLACAAAATPLQPVQPFTGTATESFEGFQILGDYPTVAAFGGLGLLNPIGSGRLLVVDEWQFIGGYVTDPHSGGQFLGPVNADLRIDFDAPVGRFGGYFTTNYLVSGATAWFYGTDLSLLGTAPVQAPAGDSAWAWDGWEFSTPVSRVEIRSNSGFGYIMADDLSSSAFTELPEPSSAILAFAGLLLAGLRLRRRR